jgi:hypothetical protein
MRSITYKMFARQLMVSYERHDRRGGAEVNRRPLRVLRIAFVLCILNFAVFMGIAALLAATPPTARSSQVFTLSAITTDTPRSTSRMARHFGAALRPSNDRRRIEYNRTHRDLGPAYPR